MGSVQGGKTSVSFLIGQLESRFADLSCGTRTEEEKLGGRALWTGHQGVATCLPPLFLAVSGMEDATHRSENWPQKLRWDCAPWSLLSGSWQQKHGQRGGNHRNLVCVRCQLGEVAYFARSDQCLGKLCEFSSSEGPDFLAIWPES